MQGVDGHVGVGLPCWLGPFAGPGVLVDDHLRENQRGRMFVVFLIGKQDEGDDDG